MTLSKKRSCFGGCGGSGYRSARPQDTHNNPAFRSALVNTTDRYIAAPLFRPRNLPGGAGGIGAHTLQGNNQQEQMLFLQHQQDTLSQLQHQKPVGLLTSPQEQQIYRTGLDEISVIPSLKTLLPNPQLTLHAATERDLMANMSMLSLSATTTAPTIMGNNLDTTTFVPSYLTTTVASNPSPCHGGVYGGGGDVPLMMFDNIVNNNLPMVMPHMMNNQLKYCASASKNLRAGGVAQSVLSLSQFSSYPAAPAHLHAFENPAVLNQYIATSTSRKRLPSDFSAIAPCATPLPSCVERQQPYYYNQHYPVPVTSPQSSVGVMPMPSLEPPGSRIGWSSVVGDGVVPSYNSSSFSNYKNSPNYHCNGVRNLPAAIPAAPHTIVEPYETQNPVPGILSSRENVVTSSASSYQQQQLVQPHSAQHSVSYHPPKQLQVISATPYCDVIVEETASKQHTPAKKTSSPRQQQVDHEEIKMVEKQEKSPKSVEATPIDPIQQTQVLSPSFKQDIPAVTQDEFDGMLDDYRQTKTEVQNCMNLIEALMHDLTILKESNSVLQDQIYEHDRYLRLESYDDNQQPQYYQDEKQQEQYYQEDQPQLRQRQQEQYYQDDQQQQQQNFEKQQDQYIKDDEQQQHNLGNEKQVSSAEREEDDTVLAVQQPISSPRQETRKSSEKDFEIDAVDIYLADFVKSNPDINLKISKVDPPMYLLNGQEAFITEKDGQVVIRDGVAWKPFVDFIAEATAPSNGDSEAEDKLKSSPEEEPVYGKDPEEPRDAKRPTSAKTPSAAKAKITAPKKTPVKAKSTTSTPSKVSPTKKTVVASSGIKTAATLPKAKSKAKAKAKSSPTK